MLLFDRTAATVRRLGPAGAVPARMIELYGHGLDASGRLLREVLRQLRPEEIPAGRGIERPSVRSASPSVAPGADAPDPTALMATLLSRSLEHNTAGSRREYYGAVLRQLVPDEARILAALAEGPPVPLVHVYKRGGGDPVLENASLIGRTAALTLPSMTPKYLYRLRHLGLVETGPEAPGEQLGYELVLAEREVRAALKEGELGKVPARVERGTIRLSPHGRDLWEATRPDTGSLA